MNDVTEAVPLDGFRVRFTFSDGKKRVLDLEPYLHGPIFDPLRKSRKRFLEFRVDPELGTIAWPNGADICPDVLYWGIKAEDLDKVPPHLKRFDVTPGNGKASRRAARRGD